MKEMKYEDQDMKFISKLRSRTWTDYSNIQM